MKYILILFFFFTTIIYGQQTEYVDFENIQAEINFDIPQKKVYGTFKCTFKILKNVDSIYLDAVAIGVKDVQFTKQSKRKTFSKREAIVGFQNKNKIWLKSNYKKGQDYTVAFSFFKINPKKALYFIDWDEGQGNKQIWTQGQGKYTSNWLPSIDDMNDKIEFDLSVIFNKDYQVISNGKLVKKEDHLGKKKWTFNMEKPMSSYLVALAIGKYHKKVVYSKSTIPLEMYYYPEDSLKFEPTYRHSKQMFDFLEAEIGVPYPWQNYKQVPVKDFLYAGMENTSTTIFADSFVIDSIAFADKNYVNVNAHELAHQWFGNLVTETSGTHHWLQEGFATYYALLAERDIFGNDYYYWRLYQYAQELLQQDNTGGSTSLLNPKSSSTTFYKKGAWALHILREQVGDKAFKQAVKSYLEKHKFKNVETQDFIYEVEKASGEDLKAFVKLWLESPEFDYNVLKNVLSSNSKPYYSFLALKDCKEDESVCLNFLSQSSNVYMKADIIKRLVANLPTNIFKYNTIKERQAIAQSVSQISPELKTDYESLLNDNSYITIETALFNLWKHFPQDRKTYFNKTENLSGFNDKNIRMLWLTLQLVSPDTESDKAKIYYDELTQYTSKAFGFEVRQNAFQYLNQIQACNTTCKENLKSATKHHNWRFSKFAKELLKSN